MKNIDGQSVNLLERSRGAFIGAAVGDALGWPYEGRATAMPPENQRQLRYIAWDKKSGGRFNAHIEHIGKGEYSDDTQLILAVARSIITAPEWWRHLATVELPFWTLYERGGGGATKRAATAWVAGAPPWKNRKQEDFDRYVDAGGNGVAMRVLPHCVRHARSSTFAELAADIMTDGVITHGHPRALVGALAYGFACWQALRRSGTLAYGELLQTTITGFDQWAVLPNITSRWRDWSSSISKGVPSYEDRWNSVSQEMLKLLEIANQQTQAGAIATVAVALEKLGAYDKASKGAGTVSAAVSVYIASRFAASPIEGLSRAAFAVGTDTDTIASMTGAVLGAVGGAAWLSPFRQETQDIRYIEDLAASVSKEGAILSATPAKEVRKTALLKVIKEFEAFDTNPAALPNGMEIEKVQLYSDPDQVTASVGPQFWKATTKDGLTLFIRGSSGGSRKSSSMQLPKNSAPLQESVSAGFAVTAIGISLTVGNIGQSRRFYEEILGLKVTGQTATAVRIENVIALREGRDSLFAPESVKVFLHVSDVAECQKKLKEHGIVVKDLTLREKAKSFECVDPDGYVIEIFERPQAS